MERWLPLVLMLAVTFAVCAPSVCAEPDQGVSLVEAARSGSLARVTDLIAAGADVNSRDDSGKTALHCAAENGHFGTVELLLKHGANADALDNEQHNPRFYALRNGHEGISKQLKAAQRIPDKQSLNPGLKYQDLAAFEKAIGERGCLRKSEHVYFFAPKRYERESAVVQPYLIKAYDALRRITGRDTEYIIVVYNFPAGHSDAFGGTSNCTLWYDESNLQLGKQDEWIRYGVPHVSGYIEEMAHNFVAACDVQFGWEMVGWSIGAKVSAEVAGNPRHADLVNDTRRQQTETYQRYVQLGFTFPRDLPGNQVDRIHAYILWQCEQRYGQAFWPDFFKEVGKRSKQLEQADEISDRNAARNARYRITVDCFDSLKGLGFKEKLQDAGVSLTVDVKSLHPEEKGWNRKLK